MTRSPPLGSATDREGDALLGAAVGLADDDVLRHVDQTAGQVPRVGRTQRGVGQTLAGAVRGDEVLENGQALAEVRLDRAVDDLALRVRHQASHAGQLADLLDVPAGSRVRHHVDGVELVEVGGHRLSDVLVRGRPHVDDLTVTLVLGDEAAVVLLLDAGDLLVARGEQAGLLVRDLDVVDGDGDAGARGVVEAETLDLVEDARHLRRGVAVRGVLDDAGDALLVDLVVDVGVVLGQRAVERHAADGGDHPLAGLAIAVRELAGILVEVLLDEVCGEAHLDAACRSTVRLSYARIASSKLRRTTAALADLALEALALGRQVVDADDHVLRRRGERTAVRRRLDVVDRQHEDAGLGLRLGGQRQVDRHLVAVEVGVERGADQRVQADGLALDEHRLERLDAEAVQRRRAVEHHGVVADDLLEHVPHDRALRARPCAWRS